MGKIAPLSIPRSGLVPKFYEPVPGIAQNFPDLFPAPARRMIAEHYGNGADRTVKTGDVIGDEGRADSQMFMRAPVARPVFGLGFGFAEPAHAAGIERQDSIQINAAEVAL